MFIILLNFSSALAAIAVVGIRLVSALWAEYLSRYFYLHTAVRAVAGALRKRTAAALAGGRLRSRRAGTFRLAALQLSINLSHSVFAGLDISAAPHRLFVKGLAVQILLIKILSQLFLQLGYGAFLAPCSAQKTAGLNQSAGFVADVFGQLAQLVNQCHIIPPVVDVVFSYHIPFTPVFQGI